MRPIPQEHPLKQLFTGLVEHAFQAELGLCEPCLADYVSELLIDFVHVDNLALGAAAIGRTVDELAEWVAQVEELQDLPGDVRQCYVHRRIGDYTLFWSGVFPEGVHRPRGLLGSDFMADYVTFGKRSYAIASELTPPGVKPPSRLLRMLSDDFESCVHGLGIVRHELEHQGTDSSGTGGDLIY